MVGNAVPVLLAKVFAAEIRRQLDQALAKKTYKTSTFQANYALANAA
jgi:hypothetical protein